SPPAVLAPHPLGPHRGAAHSAGVAQRPSQRVAIERAAQQKVGGSLAQTASREVELVGARQQDDRCRVAPGLEVAQELQQGRLPQPAVDQQRLEVALSQQIQSAGRRSHLDQRHALHGLPAQPALEPQPQALEADEQYRSRDALGLAEIVRARIAKRHLTHPYLSSRESRPPSTPMYPLGGSSVTNAKRKDSCHVLGWQKQRIR